MKKVMLLMAMVVGSFAYVSAQVAGPQIEFDRTEHDYGEIEQGGDVMRDPEDPCFS